MTASEKISRLAIRREAANPLEMPKFPPMPPEVMKRFPDMAKYEMAVEEWRRATQNVLYQAIMALKFDKSLETLMDSKIAAAIAALPRTYLGTTVVSETRFGQTGAPGVVELAARADHTHGTPPDPIPAHKLEEDPHPQYLVPGDVKDNSLTVAALLGGM